MSTQHPLHAPLATLRGASAPASTVRTPPSLSAHCVADDYREAALARAAALERTAGRLALDAKALVLGARASPSGRRRRRPRLPSSSASAESSASGGEPAVDAAEVRGEYVYYKMRSD